MGLPGAAKNGESLPQIPDRQACPNTENLQGPTGPRLWAFTPSSVRLLEPPSPLSPLPKGGPSLGGCSSPEEVRQLGENRELLSLGWISSSWDRFLPRKQPPIHGLESPSSPSTLAGAVRGCWGVPLLKRAPHGVPRNRHHLISPVHFSSLVGGGGWKEGIFLRSSA